MGAYGYANGQSGNGRVKHIDVVKDLKDSRVTDCVPTGAVSAVLLYLGHCARRNPNDEEYRTCYPSQADIAHAAGCAVRTVRYAVQDLEAWGIISRELVETGEGYAYRRRTIYTIAEYADLCRIAGSALATRKPLPRQRRKKQDAPHPWQLDMFDVLDDVQEAAPDPDPVAHDDPVPDPVIRVGGDPVIRVGGDPVIRVGGDPVIRQREVPTRINNEGNREEIGSSVDATEEVDMLSAREEEIRTALYWGQEAGRPIDEYQREELRRELFGIARRKRLEAMSDNGNAVEAVQQVPAEQADDGVPTVQEKSGRPGRQLQGVHRRGEASGGPPQEVRALQAGPQPGRLPPAWRPKGWPDPAVPALSYADRGADV